MEEDYRRDIGRGYFMIWGVVILFGGHKVPDPLMYISEDSGM